MPIAKLLDIGLTHGACLKRISRRIWEAIKIECAQPCQLIGCPATAIPKLGAGKVSDWEYVGLCSSPAVEGNRMWLVTNRGEVVCLDTEGMANGNDGPYKDEAKY